MSTLNEVGICNLALGWLGANLISSLDDEAVEAQLCKANFIPLRNAVLEAYEWTFAQKRFKPASLSTPPPWGYTYQFGLPDDILRIVYVGNSDRIAEDDPVEYWTKELGPDGKGSVIMTQQAVIYCRGIVTVDDTAVWSELFAQALAARLAADICMALTNSRTMSSDMWSLFSKKVADADRTDGKQGKGRILRAPGILDARRSGGGRSGVGPFV